MKYRNLFFDLDDTIWAFSRNARDTFEEVYRKYSFERYFDSFDHFYAIYQKRNRYTQFQNPDPVSVPEKLSSSHQ